MNEISIHSIHQLLSLKIDKLNKEIEAIERAKRALMSVGGESEFNFKGMKLADAIEAYLSEKGLPTQFDEIAEALEQGGAELGERGTVNARIAITSNKSRFFWDNNKVGLHSWNKEKGQLRDCPINRLSISLCACAPS